MKVAVRRFSAVSGARFEDKGTVFLHPQSQISKTAQIDPIPDGPLSVIANPPNSSPLILSSSHRLLSSGPISPTSSFIKLLTSLSRMGHHAKVLSLFNEMGLRRSPSDLLTLNIVIKSCCCLNLKHGDGVDYGLSVLGAIFKNGYRPDTVTYTTLIKGLFLEGRTNDAFRLFHQLSRYGQPNVVTYGTMIDGLCKMGYVGMGFGFVGHMVKKGVEVNGVIFTTLIKGLFSKGEGNAALKLFCKLPRVLGGAKLDYITYGTVMDRLCEMGNVGAALCLLGEMVKKGALLNVLIYNSGGHLNLNHRLGASDDLSVPRSIVKNWYQPEKVIFTTLLKGLFAVGRTADAFRFLKLSRDFQPDIVNYGIVIHGLCEMRNTGVAFGFLGEMIKKGVMPNVVIFNTLLKGLYSNCEANTALKLFRKLCLILEDIRPDHVTYGIVIDGLCRMGKVDAAFSLLGEMVKKDVTANVVALSTLIKALFSKGEVNYALKLFHKLPHVSDVQPNQISYRIVIDGLCKNGNVCAAIDLLRDMKSASCYPDTEMYSAIMEGLCKKRRVDDAFSFLGTMFKIGVIPDVVTYSTLINGLCMDEKLERAWKLFSHLSAEGIQPTVYTYTIMINGLCQHGFLQEAKGLLLKMEENGCEPNEVTFNTIVNGFLRWNRKDEAVELLLKMIDRKYSPLNSSMSKVVDILADEPNHEYCRLTS